MLQQIAKELDRMEGKIQHMRMTLDDLFKDMEETARHVEQLHTNGDQENEADKIEEALDEENADEGTDTDEDGNDDTNNTDKTED